MVFPVSLMILGTSYLIDKITFDGSRVMGLNLNLNLPLIICTDTLSPSAVVGKHE